MLIIRCTDNLPEVGGGYVCMVGVRSLRHMTTMDMVNAMQAVGVVLVLVLIRKFDFRFWETLPFLPGPVF